MSDKRPILVTGASGFIGSRLVERLSTAGRRVHVLLRDGTKDARFHIWGCRIFKGDVTAQASIASAVADCSTVFNCARGGGDLERPSLDRGQCRGSGACCLCGGAQRWPERI